MQDGVRRTFIRAGESLVAERIAGDADLLLATDVKKTVLAEHDGDIRMGAYCAHGYRSASRLLSGMGFNGEWLESSGVYLLGSHRAYNPVLLVMHSPDSFSPFDDGGLNGYGYCLGNPVGLVDPTGRIPQWVIPVLGAGLGAVGLALTIASMGAAASITVMQTVSFFSGVASAATGFAGGGMQAAKPESEAGNVLGLSLIHI